ncbi:MAG: RC-LH1 core complex protein PufX [Rhodobacteraceae bacterium]|jgi:hypothetical protein|nr:RC-LH1 core complex protein PufX [Paracoccaceae bacterium]MBL4557452.1 RC-LH1 core complex protein PufX [Paracoccaceae bacterium]HBG99891.1 hypothetical protein [Paracoccaceae bacterium]
MSRDFQEALENHDKANLRDVIARDMIRGAAYTAALVSLLGVSIWVFWAIGEYGLRANLPDAESHMAIDPTFEGYWTE